MSHSVLKFSVVAVIAFTAVIRGNSQNAGLPDVFKQQPVPEQLKYLEEHTRIYDNYRAIREDMFRVVSKNTIDSINKQRQKINSLTQQTVKLNLHIDSLNKILAGTSNDLEKAVRTKENIPVLGMSVNKTSYNSIMWGITGILLLLLIIGYFSYKQNRNNTLRTRRDIEELKTEFEEYKKKARLEREKTTMEHFNEIKKLKANLPGSRP
jgi:hypothetical protein